LLLFQVQKGDDLVFKNVTKLLSIFFQKKMTTNNF